MARISASKFTSMDPAVSGVDPSTGAYLSAAQRKALFRKSNISSSKVFAKPGAIVKVGSSDIDVKVLNVRVIAVEKQVAFLAKALDKEAELEKKSQRDYEKKALQQEEKKLRSGEEKKLEKGLSKKLLSPVKSIGRKTGGLLGNLLEFFGVLFAGWLTNQGILALKAKEEGNQSKLEEIRDRVLKDLAAVGTIFAVLNGGLFTILGIIGGITARILTKPFRALFKAFRGGGKPTPTPTPKPKPSGGKPGSARVATSGGKPVKPLSRFDLEQARKKVTQERMLSNDKKPGLFKRIASKLKKIFPKDKAVNFAADLATKPKSVFAKIFGALGNLGKKILPLLRAAFFVGAVRDRATKGMTPAQSILGAMFPLAGSIVGGGLGAGIGLAGGPLSFLGAFAGSWLGDYLGIQVQRFLDFVWKPSWDGAPGIKNFNDTIYSLQSEGVLGSALQGVFPYSGTSGSTEKPGEGVESSSASLTSSSPSATASSSVTSTSSVPSIASPASPQMQPPGPVSASGNTTVIYKKVPSSGQVMGSPKASKSATDVPLISSSNPDNFYTMYSQIAYNAVT